MRMLKGLIAVLALASLAACSPDFGATPSSQAYQDYMTNAHINPNAAAYDHGW